MDSSDRRRVQKGELNPVLLFGNPYFNLGVGGTVALCQRGGNAAVPHTVTDLTNAVDIKTGIIGGPFSAEQLRTELFVKIGFPIGRLRGWPGGILNRRKIVVGLFAG